MMRLLFFLVVISVFSVHPAGAQKGHPYITNFGLPDELTDHRIWSIAQDKDESMLFANRRGILAYDGVAWLTIPVEHFTYTVWRDPGSDRIFVGCNNDYGTLVKDETGSYRYQSLNDTVLHNSVFTKILSDGSYLYFYSSKQIIKIDYIDMSHQTIIASEPGLDFTGFFKLGASVYVNVEKLGLHILSAQNKPILMNAGDELSGQKIITAFPFNKGNVLIGTDNSALYLFDGEEISPYKIKDQEYLNESVLAGGINLTQNHYALSTLTGGCMILDKKEGVTLYTVNYQTGLPDDEIYAIGADRNKGIWVSHDFGISRIDYALPVKTFMNYPGLQGNLSWMCEYSGRLYVSTSEGVYYLDEVRDYSEIQQLVENKQTDLEDLKLSAVKTSGAVSAPAVITKEPMKINDAELTKTKGKKGFFKRLFKRKNKGNPEKPNQNEAGTETPHDTITNTYNATPPTQEEEKVNSVPVLNRKSMVSSAGKKVYALQSIGYMFRKVEGLDEKCKQLLPIKDRILVATNTGLYEIKDDKSSAVIKDLYVNQITMSKNHNHYYLATTSGVLSAFLENDKWDVHNLLPDMHQNVYAVIEDDHRQLWLGGENVAYNIIVDKEGNPVQTKSFYFNQEYSERVLVRNVFGKPYFFLSSGVYLYNDSLDSLVYSKKINSNFPAGGRYIFTQQDLTWIFNGHSWELLNLPGNLTEINDRMIELFDDVQQIFIDASQSIWVLNNSRQLCRIQPGANAIFNRNINVYFKGIEGLGGQLFKMNKLRLDYENNALVIRLAAPYYLKTSGTEYSYFLEGVTSDWSHWSSNAILEFPYLPPGHFVLKIKSRNVFGFESQPQELSFVIAPPVWRRWWFISLAVIIVMGLMYFVVRIREARLKRTKRLLELKIKMRTKQLEEQKDKVEELLLNILPEETAEELKATGRSEPKSYEQVSVLFTDFEGFTKISQTITPSELVTELDTCFIAFDEIISKYSLEKIKTIGDGYMAAGGIPAPNRSNAVQAILAGFEIQAFMQKVAEEKMKNKQPYWVCRLGIHTGPLVAGVVGKKKFAYDIWGDTVNTASRMESNGEPGKINISGDTYALVKDYFKCSYRGKIEAKNKGKIDMYFVDDISKDFKSGGNGMQASPKLFHELDKLNHEH